MGLPEKTVPLDKPWLSTTLLYSEKSFLPCPYRVVPSGLANSFPLLPLAPFGYVVKEAGMFALPPGRVQHQRIQYWTGCADSDQFADQPAHDEERNGENIHAKIEKAHDNKHYTSDDCRKYGQ